MFGGLIRMNLFNKLTNFFFPKKEPIQFPLTYKEAEDLLSDLLTNCRELDMIGYLLGCYLSGCCNKNEIEQKIKKLREATAKFQENSLMKDNEN